MSAQKSSKSTVEVLLAGAELGGIKLQPHLVKTTRHVTVDMICPRSSIAKMIGHVKLELKA